MVNVVNESINGYGYRETNLQLARENGELRQQLSLVLNDNAHQREEVHKRDVKIVELTSQLKELTNIKKKYDSILRIMLDITDEVSQISGQIDRRSRLHQLGSKVSSLTHEQPASLCQEERPLAISNRDAHIICDEDQLSAASRTTYSIGHQSNSIDSLSSPDLSKPEHNRHEPSKSPLNATSPHSDVEEEPEENPEDNNRSFVRTRLEPISERSDETREQDSLEPRDVTSMAAFNHVETVINAESIFHMLDDIEIDENIHNKDEKSSNEKSQQLPLNTTTAQRSTTINNIPTSPIQPIGQNAAISINVFHSTPVTALGVDRQFNKNQSPANTSNVRRSIQYSRVDLHLSSPSKTPKDNQENVVLVSETVHDAHDKEANVVKPKTAKKAQGRKRKAPKNEPDRPKKAQKPSPPESKQQEQEGDRAVAPPVRYNLRNRTKASVIR